MLAKTFPVDTMNHYEYVFMPGKMEKLDPEGIPVLACFL
jgi:hypothetical protein